jgi:hypothetical protein
MLVEQCRSVVSLKMPKLLLIERLASWISAWSAPSLSCSCLQYCGFGEAPTRGGAASAPYAARLTS